MASYGDSPATSAFVVTPHDTNELASIPRALYIGGAGNVKVTMLDGTDITFSGLSAGSVLPIRIKRVFATGTTTTLMLGLK